MAIFYEGGQGFSTVNYRRVILKESPWMRNTCFENRGKLKTECIAVRQVVSCLVDTRDERVGRYLG